MINLYTDGACSPNPGIGGWGACFSLNNKRFEVFGYQENTTNNRMELTAIIEGLKFIKEIIGEKNVSIYSDSQYIINTMKNNWKKKLNLDLWDSLDNLIQNMNIDWIWIKGHNDNKYNEICDKLAVKARLNKIDSIRRVLEEF